jgi:hypothetical protein
MPRSIEDLDAVEKRSASPSSHGGDKAVVSTSPLDTLAALGHDGEPISAADSAPIDEAEKKRVLRKIDTILMPLMYCSVLLQFLDKTSLNVSGRAMTRAASHRC